MNSNRIVVIENQLEETDHDHLGKTLTYAAGKEAEIVIWISPQFREEHQQALEWLNELSREQTSFFGVEVEVLQIDDGRPAANFKIVAKPNWWQKAQAAPPISEKQQKYQGFFAELLKELKTIASYKLDPSDNSSVRTQVCSRRGITPRAGLIGSSRRHIFDLLSHLLSYLCAMGKWGLNPFGC